MRELDLRICGLGLRLRSEDGRLLSAGARRYRTFVAGRGEDLRLDLSVASRRLCGTRDEPRISKGGARVERHDFKLDWDGRSGRAALLRGAAPLDGLLRVVLSLALSRRGGFLCHAAAVDGRLFPGRSGAGKSTLGRKVPAGRLLADELVGVIAGRLHSTPFWGDFRAGRENGSRALESIVILDRRAPRGVRPLSKGRALAGLLECAFFFEDGVAASRRLLASARRCVEAAPAFVLSYEARGTGFREIERMLKGARA